MFVAKSTGLSYMHHTELRKALGLPRKLPSTGMGPVEINVGGRNVWFYLDPQRPLKPGERRRMTHRVFALCPSCHAHVPASRLAQHEGTQRCHALYSYSAKDVHSAVAAHEAHMEDLAERLHEATLNATKDWTGYWWSKRHQQFFAPSVTSDDLAEM